MILEYYFIILFTYTIIAKTAEAHPIQKNLPTDFYQKTHLIPKNFNSGIIFDQISKTHLITRNFEKTYDLGKNFVERSVTLHTDKVEIENICKQTIFKENCYQITELIDEYISFSETTILIIKNQQNTSEITYLLSKEFTHKIDVHTKAILERLPNIPHLRESVLKIEQDFREQLRDAKIYLNLFQNRNPSLAKLTFNEMSILHFISCVTKELKPNERIMNEFRELYDVLKTASTHITYNYGSVMLHIRMPIISDQIYDVYEINSFSISNGNFTFELKLNEILLHERHGNNNLTLSKDEYLLCTTYLFNTKLCNLSFLFEKDQHHGSCEARIFENQTENIQNICEITTTKSENQMFDTNHDNTYLCIVPNPFTALIECTNSKPFKFYIMSSGILKLHPNCTLITTNQNNMPIIKLNKAILSVTNMADLYHDNTPQNIKTENNIFIDIYTELENAFKLSENAVKQEIENAEDFIETAKDSLPDINPKEIMTEIGDSVMQAVDFTDLIYETMIGYIKSFFLYIILITIAIVIIWIAGHFAYSYTRKLIIQSLINKRLHL